MTAREELADGETVKPPFHEKRGPRPKTATMERRKARHLPLKVPKTTKWRRAALHPPHANEGKLKMPRAESRREMNFSCHRRACPGDPDQEGTAVPNDRDARAGKFTQPAQAWLRARA
jgi:hypothetical protein